MCAVSIEGVPDEPAKAEGAPGVVVDDAYRAYHDEETLPVEQQAIICPEYNTSNEVGWSFCQQCGKRLPKSPPPPPLSKTPHGGFTTVRDQQAIVDPGSLPKETSPPREQGVRTVPDKPSALTDSLRTAPNEIPSNDEAATVAVEAFEESSKPESTAPPTAPGRVVEPPQEPAGDAATVITEAPIVPPVAQSDTAPVKQPVESPPPAASDDATQHVQSVTGVLCRQCGQTTNAGSAFCANCGAPVGVGGETMVMSSPPASSAPKGRLHLVMEGGQPGDVYDLGEETLIGRSSGNITFPHDGFMSGRHARIVRKGNSYVLTDQDSRNGTFIKINDDVELKPGDMILVGKQLFRFEV